MASGQFSTAAAGNTPLDNGNGLLTTSLDSSRARSARGRGIAVSYKNVGYSFGFPEHCTAWVELHGAETIERARVGCVGAEVGQGAHTAFILLTAEMLGLSPQQVELEAADTDVTGLQRQQFRQPHDLYGRQRDPGGGRTGFGAVER